MPSVGATAPLVLAYAPRERTRAWIRRVSGKRLVRLVLARTVKEFVAYFQEELVDAALIDLSASDGVEQVAALTLEYPSVAFFGITSFRPSDGPAIARCAELEFADVLVEGVDECVVRDLVTRYGYTARFASALESPPPMLSLESALHLSAWRFIVGGGGRPIRTTALASSLGLTREHLSRSFGSDGTPTLKRLIDLVRLLSAAELAKNPGYDVPDVSRILKFSSSAHLSQTAQRLIGRRATSLAAMRGVDVLESFRQGERGGAAGRANGANRANEANRGT